MDHLFLHFRYVSSSRTQVSSDLSHWSTAEKKKALKGQLSAQVRGSTIHADTHGSPSASLSHLRFSSSVSFVCSLWHTQQLNSKGTDITTKEVGVLGAWRRTV